MATASALSAGFGLSSAAAVIPGESQEQFDAILSQLHRELRPRGELETFAVYQAAECIWRMRRVATELNAELAKSGFSDRYFRLQRSEAKDRAGFHAAINQFRQLESRRIRQVDRMRAEVDKALDRAVTPKTAAQPPDPPVPEAAPPPSPFAAWTAPVPGQRPNP